MNEFAAERWVSANLPDEAVLVGGVSGWHGDWRTFFSDRNGSDAEVFCQHLFTTLMNYSCCRAYLCVVVGGYILHKKIYQPAFLLKKSQKSRNLSFDLACSRKGRRDRQRRWRGNARSHRTRR